MDKSDGLAEFKVSAAARGISEESAEARWNLVTELRDSHDDLQRAWNESLDSIARGVEGWPEADGLAGFRAELPALLEAHAEFVVKLAESARLLGLSNQTKGELAALAGGLLRESGFLAREENAPQFAPMLERVADVAAKASGAFPGGISRLARTEV